MTTRERTQTAPDFCTMALYSRTMPLYSRTVPLYSRTMPLYSRTMPLYDRTVPLYSRAVPLYSHTVPLYDRTVPLYDRAVPLYDLQVADRSPIPRKGLLIRITIKKNSGKSGVINNNSKTNTLWLELKSRANRSRC